MWTDFNTLPAYHGPGVAVALIRHLDRGSPDVLSFTFLHLTPFFSPAEQLLDPGRSGASMKDGVHRISLMKCIKTLKHTITQQHLNAILVQDGQIFTSLNSFDTSCSIE